MAHGGKVAKSNRKAKSKSRRERKVHLGVPFSIMDLNLMKGHRRRMINFLSVVEWMFDGDGRGGVCSSTLTQPRLAKGSRRGKADLYVVVSVSLVLRPMSLAPFARR